MVLLLCGLITIGPAGCFSIVKDTRVQQIEVKTVPPGSLVSTKDEDGRIVHRGVAPVVIEQRYTASIKRFRRWHWLWPALAAVQTGIGLYWWSRSDWGTAQGEDGGLALTAYGIVALLATTAGVLYGEVASGKVARVEPSEVALVIRPPGGEAQDRQIGLAPNGGRWASTVTVDPGAGPTSAPSSAPALPPLARGTLLAVFDVDDQVGSLGERVLSEITGRLSAKLSALHLDVVPRDQIRARLGTPAGQLRCYPGTCHTEVARAVLAQKTLWTRVQRIGAACALSTSLYTVGSTTFERRATVSSDCSPASLLRAADQLAVRIAGQGDPSPP